MAERWLAGQEWLDGLDAETRVKADSMIALLQRFGCKDPIGWVRSELTENIPQTARFLFLHELRSSVLNNSPFGVPDESDFETNLPPAARLGKGDEAFDKLVRSGADVRDIVRVARAAACAACFDSLCFLDDMFDSQSYFVEGAPHWELMETVNEADEHKMTGRNVDGLHESFFSLYETDE